MSATGFAHVHPARHDRNREVQFWASFWFPGRVPGVDATFGWEPGLPDTAAHDPGGREIRVEAVA